MIYILLVALLVVVEVSSLSTHFLTSTSAFCVQLDHPPQTLLRASYKILPDPAKNFPPTSAPKSEIFGKIYSRVAQNAPQDHGLGRHTLVSENNVKRAKDLIKGFKNKPASEAGSGNVSEKPLAYDEMSGELTFTLEQPVIHDLCVQFLSASPKTPIQFSLDVRTGRSSSYYLAQDSQTQKTRLSSLQLMANQLNDEMRSVMNEADFMKGKEIEFHNVSKEIEKSSGWWLVVKCVLLVGIGGLQVWHLEGFFKKRKLV